VAGYSDTPLHRKLGIREGGRVVLVGAPAGLADALEPLPAGVVLLGRARGPLDVVLLFATRADDVERRFGALAAKLRPAGGLWLCWPKRSSGVPTDVTEGRLREICLSHGLVDNKVCAIDETWSALRFVWRLANR